MIEIANSPELPLYLTALGLYGLAFSKAIRKEVYERQHGRCGMCGAYLPKLETHHIIPHCISRDDSEDNAVGLCRNCHLFADRMALRHHIFYPDSKIIWEQQDYGETTD
jgi:hypothetical protein